MINKPHMVNAGYHLLVVRRNPQSGRMPYHSADASERNSHLNASALYTCCGNNGFLCPRRFYGKKRIHLSPAEFVDS